MTASPVKYGMHPKIPEGAPCETCGSAIDRIVTDHCHTHGWVRGLACARCNYWMGVIDRRVAPKVEATLINALIALWRRCPDCSASGTIELDLDGMSDAQDLDADRLVRYPLTWPASMAERVAAEAKARTMPMAVWLREAIREKLERIEEGRPDLPRFEVNHKDGNRRNNDPSNLELGERQS